MRISDWSSDVCSSDLVGGVERQVDAAGPQHRQVEQQGLGRFLDLRGNAVSRLDTAIDEQAREAAGTGLEIGIAHAPAGGRLEHRAGAAGREVRLQQGIEIGHRMALTDDAATAPQAVMAWKAESG